MNHYLHIRPGLITAGLLIILTLVFHYFKIDVASTFQLFITMLIIIGGVILSCKGFKKQFPEAPKKEVFFHGFRTTTIIALVMIAFAFLFIQLVPEFKRTAIRLFEKQQMTQANGNAALIEQAKKDVADYASRFTTLFIGLNMMIIVLTGFAGAAIAAFINPIKRKA
jgi:hypothetical protein